MMDRKKQVSPRKEALLHAKNEVARNNANSVAIEQFNAMKNAIGNDIDWVSKKVIVEIDGVQVTFKATAGELNNVVKQIAGGIF